MPDRAGYQTPVRVTKLVVESGEMGSLDVTFVVTRPREGSGLWAVAPAVTDCPPDIRAALLVWLLPDCPPDIRAALLAWLLPEGPDDGA